MFGNVLLGLVVMIAFFAYLLWIPDGMRDAINWMFNKMWEILTGLLNGSFKLLSIAGVIAHLAGKMATSLLLAGSLAIFFNELIAVFGFEKFLYGDQYVALLVLLTKPYAWSAATTIVASTVAIGHAKKYDLDLEDFTEKQLERIEKRRKEREEKGNRPLPG